MDLTEAVYYILLSLTTPLHGYGIMQRVGRLSDGRVTLAAGTLYGALSTLVGRGWIEEVPTPSDSRKKEYVLTSTGRGALDTELIRLTELVRNGRTVLKGVAHDHD
jgi:DNA-binding PadR family transcriptional regulator